MHFVLKFQSHKRQTLIFSFFSSAYFFWGVKLITRDQFWILLHKVGATSRDLVLQNQWLLNLYEATRQKTLLYFPTDNTQSNAIQCGTIQYNFIAPMEKFIWLQWAQPNVKHPIYCQLFRPSLLCKKSNHTLIIWKSAKYALNVNNTHARMLGPYYAQRHL